MLPERRYVDHDAISGAVKRSGVRDQAAAARVKSFRLPRDGGRFIFTQLRAMVQVQLNFDSSRIGMLSVHWNCFQFEQGELVIQLIDVFVTLVGACTVLFKIIRWTGVARWGGWLLLGEVFAGATTPVRRKMSSQRLERLVKIVAKPWLAVGDIIMATLMAMLCAGVFLLIVIASRFPASGTPSLSVENAVLAILILTCSAAAFLRAIESYHELCHAERLVEREQQRLARLSPDC